MIGAARSVVGIEYVKACIAQRYPQVGLRVADLARDVGLSPRQLQRLLAAHATSFRDLLERTRIDEAERLLAKTSASVDKIAAECGFSSRQVFSRVFTRLNGVPPSEFRQGQGGTE